MDERRIITNTEEENRAVNPQDKSPEEAPTSKEASHTENENERADNEASRTKPTPAAHSRVHPSKGGDGQSH
ncbi:MAG: hypothetical protein J7497_00220 [Chitinophagaceae bacterium]|nr:hypothetical protein [Chitinophagaceae bacterium]